MRLRKARLATLCIVFVVVLYLSTASLAVSESTGAVSGAEALRLLADGNARFLSGGFAAKDLGVARRQDLSAHGQRPFAVIVSCSDSRVPPEILFDQGLGDLFVVRVAGNVIDPVVAGSVEYAVEHLGVRLVLVMGHEKCGAVKAAVDGGEAPGSIGSIVKAIEPSVVKLSASGVGDASLYEAVADENVQVMVNRLKESPILEHLAADGLVLAGAKYHLESGIVTFNPQ